MASLQAKSMVRPFVMAFWKTAGKSGIDVVLQGVLNDCDQARVSYVHPC